MCYSGHILETNSSPPTTAATCARLHWSSVTGVVLLSDRDTTTAELLSTWNDEGLRHTGSGQRPQAAAQNQYA